MLLSAVHVRQSSVSKIPWGKLLIYLCSGFQRQAHLPLAIRAASQMRNACVKRCIFYIPLNIHTHISCGWKEACSTSCQTTASQKNCFLQMISVQTKVHSRMIFWPLRNCKTEINRKKHIDTVLQVQRTGRFTEASLLWQCLLLFKVPCTGELRNMFHQSRG